MTALSTTEGSTMKLELTHADTCLPDYWGGHHLAHVQIPVVPGMSGRDIREAIRSEISQGAVMGSDDIARILANDHEMENLNYVKFDSVHRAAYAAINRMRPARKGQRRFFTDIEVPDDDGDCVYAYFVFIPID